MITMLFFGFTEIFRQWRVSLVMAFSLSISLMSFFILQGYVKDLKNRYDWREDRLSVLLETGSPGEMHGSRLPSSVRALVESLGISPVVSAVQTVTGITPEDAVLLRGIQLDTYDQVDRFRVLSGRPLRPGDPTRLVMAGVRLAEERGLTVGSTLAIRGRDFQVVGVFENGTYGDYEAWISLTDAQTLLGWGDDISVLIIPSQSASKLAGKLPAGISIVPRGESGRNLVAEWNPFLGLLSLVTIFLGIASGIALANSLLRLAWLRRREIAILQTVGFSRSALAVYMATQGAVITLIGFGLGLVEALSIGTVFRLQAIGVAIRMVVDLPIVTYSLVFALVIFLLSSLLPVWWLSRLNISTLLRKEV